jgi:hypothetical protein
LWPGWSDQSNYHAALWGSPLMIILCSPQETWPSWQMHGAR